MNLRRAITLAVWWAIPVLGWSQRPSEMKPVTDRLAASIYNGPSMTTLGELADGIGGRLTGSPAYVRSTAWAAAKFRSYGIENVRLEPFTIPAGWQRGTASGAMIAPLSRPLNVASLGWSPSTPAGGVRGNVVMVADVAPDVLRSREGDLRGKIVFLDTAKIMAEGFGKALPKLESAWLAFQKAAVLAVVVPDREENNGFDAHGRLWGAEMLPLSGGRISIEGARVSQTELGRGPVSLQIV